MSTTTEKSAETRQLKDLGWQCRGVEGAHYYERPGYVLEDGKPVKTEVLPTPGGASRSARKIQDAIDDGQIKVFERESSDEEMGPELKGLRESINAGRAGAEAGAVSELCRSIIKELDRVETLPHFQEVVVEDGLEPLTEGHADPRFTAHETGLLKDALDRAAARAGMTKAEAAAPAAGNPPSEAEMLAAHRKHMAEAAREVAEEDAPRERAPFVEPEITQISHEDAEARTGAAAPALNFGDSPADVGQHLLSQTQQMLPSKLRTHQSLLMRAGGLDREHVESLRAKLEAGGMLPPLDIFYDDAEGIYWVADGNHRYEAALPGGHILDVRIHVGTLEDAILFAIGANADHGLTRTHDDKRLQVVHALARADLWKMSDGVLKDLTHTSQPFVGAIRRDLGSIFAYGLDADAGEIVARAEVSPGLVRILKGLPEEELARLTQNIMSDDGLRTGRDGRLVDTTKPLARDDAPLQPDLLSVEEDVSGEQQPKDAAAALDALADAFKRAHSGDGHDGAPAEVGSSAVVPPSVVVNDRRRFADEADALRRQDESPSRTTTADPAPRAQEPRPDRWAEVEKLARGRAVVISHTLMPKGLGVQITVNFAGAPPSDAHISKLYATDKVMRLGEAEFEMILQRINADKGKRAPAKTAAAKKTPATKTKRRPTHRSSTRSTRPSGS